MTPTPTPPCLGEREAVARHTAICDILFYKLSANEDHGEAWIDGQDECVDATSARHIEPLRIENETLRAERDAAIARAEEQANRIAQMERWLGLTGDPALRPTIEASHELAAQFDDRFRARVRENFALTTPEHPHGV